MYKWDVSKVAKVPHGYWLDISNQRSFMDALAQKLDIKAASDWFRVTEKMIHENGGGGLLTTFYNGSLSKLLSTVYPEYQRACRTAVLRVVNDLKLNKMEDLLDVPQSEIFYRIPQLMKQHSHMLIKCTCYKLLTGVVLVTAFPELNLKAPTRPSYATYAGYWKNMNNQRAFFDQLANKFGKSIPNEDLTKIMSFSIIRNEMLILFKTLRIFLIGIT